MFDGLERCLQQLEEDAPKLGWRGVDREERFHKIKRRSRRLGEMIEAKACQLLDVLVRAIPNSLAIPFIDAVPSFSKTSRLRVPYGLPIGSLLAGFSGFCDES